MIATIDILLGEIVERDLHVLYTFRSESETILCTHSTQQAMRVSVETLNAASREGASVVLQPEAATRH